MSLRGNCGMALWKVAMAPSVAPGHSLLGTLSASAISASSPSLLSSSLASSSGARLGLGLGLSGARRQLCGGASSASSLMSCGRQQSPGGPLAGGLVACRRFFTSSSSASTPSNPLRTEGGTGGWVPNEHPATPLNTPQQLAADVYHCSCLPQTGVSLKYMRDFAAKPTETTLIHAAQFLHHELPIRLAHRVRELESLPHGLADSPQIIKVRDLYLESFKRLRQFKEIKDGSDELKFTQLIESIKHNHRNVVPCMALGIASLKNKLVKRGEDSFVALSDIHGFLDGFYMSRVGIRMLIGQHVALHQPTRPSYVGLIGTNVRPVEVAQDAIADARHICDRQYGYAPEVDVFGDPELNFAYVPEHLHQMLFELTKNSLRAVIDRHGESTETPKIRVIVAEGLEDVTIKVSDEGGGIPRSGLRNIWTYLYTTAQSPILKLADEKEAMSSLDDIDTPSVLAGYGYGLPISRLYARYFGGDLQILSMEGYGTDAYLHLNRLGNTVEPLP